jgi:hypothetical protein
MSLSTNCPGIADTPKTGFQPSKMQKPAVIARFSAFLAYVFAARRTVGQKQAKQ